MENITSAHHTSMFYGAVFERHMFTTRAYNLHGCRFHAKKDFSYAIIKYKKRDATDKMSLYFCC